MAKISKKIFISFCIPTLNRPKFLKQSLMGLLNIVGLNQLLYEVIISDDSKNDQTKKIVLEQSKKNERIIYLENKMPGQFDNLNNLIKYSQGKWIVFLHDDDVLEPDYLKYTFFSKDFSDELDMIWTAKKVVNNSGGNIVPQLKNKSIQFIKFDTKKFFVNVIIKKNFHLFTQKISHPMITGLAIKREICLKVDFFENHIPLIADGLFLWKALLCSNKALFINKALIAYRASKDSETDLKFSLGERYYFLWKKLYIYLYQYMLKIHYHPIKKKEFWYYFYKQLFDINGCLLWTSFRSKCSYICRLKRIILILKQVWKNYPLIYLQLRTWLVIFIALMPRIILDFLYRLYYMWFAYSTS